ncbi:hypothetical protein A2641_01955 [Candidatus Nomurabacteria bacterium RIFCSPHIGHO2_01_FULL_37_25]|uniref:Uncharacterized protein n=1 Tax=Candidatus Nomurabacteria bacterium RIFCSPLOWO2_01_FULL_36_16 TaxID=1801767 RepID=A0A1F6WYL5_9BACT|nr:MAG: hypothetical protein A2641_01955 [Candidatus Nomurabacteria bacterium RIFCSPHIGHO2_01_FULL_37_25]OGI75757.1 MAG: hypothetical protein A3D36_00115 [Candidatus Nomurabacteria bacterium RIFCSPHIGHO2_02_FULL_36_29]OGI86996.1 MAG: hypothetical protein A3A91_00705 [Candidatus Nomurabacteria bacterium RIFCSPLOWO2_01_FULL_36_16]OGI97048.1 MAG: hypothetical protein A3I84_01895 [Candidatus Nomurabacteria bacterium RIFCSPLOWO2_02_FULL_36_8]
MKKILKFFDKLEDKVRGKLSHYPIVYALFGGIGVVLFWRGVWHIADDINISSIVSILIGSIILLVTGVFVSAFIGNRLIISGLSGEKKLAEKEVNEIKTEEAELQDLQSTLSRLEKKLDHIDQDIEKR